MTKKYIAIFSFALILCLALGFGVMNNGPKEDPNSTNAPVFVTDNIISGSGNTSNNNLDAVWTESFDGLALPSGWLNIQESGTGLWTFVGSGVYPTTTPHSGAGMASFICYTYYATTAASLVSSSFSLTAGPGKLGFWMVRDAGYATNADKVDFMINTSPSSTGATLLGTINRSKTLTPVETGADGWYYYEFTIPTSFNTATNYIVMKATSAYGNNIFLDDVSVSLLLSIDVGTYSIDVPNPTSNQSQIPKATVKNFGTATQTFPVTMTITPGGYTSTKTVTSLASGTTTQVSFDSWTPAGSSVNITCYTQLSTDLDKTNDTLRKAVTTQNQITGSWIAIAPFVYGAAGGIGAAVIPNTTNILTAGGSPSATIANCYLYNPTTDTYTPKASLPVARAYGKVVRVKDTLYYVHSIGTSFTAPDGALYKYNATADSWTAMASQSPAIQEGAVVVWKDSLIIVIGGSTNGFTAPVNTVAVFNPWNNTWTTLAGTVPSAAMGYSGECFGNEIVIVGGVSGGSIVNLCYRGTITPGNPISISWRTMTNPYGEGVYRAPTAKNGNYIFFGPAQKSATPPFGKLIGFKTTDSTILNMAPDMNPPLGNITGMPLIQGVDSTYLFTFGGYSGSVVSNCWKYAFKNIVTGITNNQTSVPVEYALSQNYPNPFNPTTKITFALPKEGFVTLKIYDIMGREVRTLVNEHKTANTYNVEFNASELSSGVYFYRLNVNGFSEIKKMMLIK
jgi:hypothetical protein